MKQLASWGSRIKLDPSRVCVTAMYFSCSKLWSANWFAHQETDSAVDGLRRRKTKVENTGKAQPSSSNSDQLDRLTSGSELAETQPAPTFAHAPPRRREQRRPNGRGQADEHRSSLLLQANNRYTYIHSAITISWSSHAANNTSR